MYRFWKQSNHPLSVSKILKRIVNDKLILSKRQNTGLSFSKVIRNKRAEITFKGGIERKYKV